MLQMGELSLADLVESRNAIDHEIFARAEMELRSLDARREELLDILGHKPVEVIREKPPVKSMAAKYRDPETGKTWCGKGKRPKWFDTERKTDFLIQGSIL